MRTPYILSIPRCHKAYGVSLLEVIAVITIVAAAAVIGVGIVKPSTYETLQSRTACEPIVESLRMAQQTALSRSTSILVRLASSQRVEVIGPDSSGRMSEVLMTLELSDTQAVSGRPSQVTFLPSGDASTSLDWKVGNGEHPWSLSLLPAGGRVVLKKPI